MLSSNSPGMGIDDEVCKFKLIENGLKILNFLTGHSRSGAGGSKAVAQQCRMEEKHNVQSSTARRLVSMAVLSWWLMQIIKIYADE